MIQNYMNASSLTYDIDPGSILEYEVCEYPFAFWQYKLWECEDIPDASASVTGLYQHLEDAGGFPLYSDEYMDYYMPMYYQAYAELGWYRLVNDHLMDLLITHPKPTYSFFIPKNIIINFNSQVMQDVEHWLQTKGNNIIYIYGDEDPWTAAAIELTGQTNALKIVQQGLNHRISIDKLDNPEVVYDQLEEWLDLEIVGQQSNILGSEHIFERLECRAYFVD